MYNICNIYEQFMIIYEDYILNWFSS